MLVLLALACSTPDPASTAPPAFDPSDDPCAGDDCGPGSAGASPMRAFSKGFVTDVPSSAGVTHLQIAPTRRGVLISANLADEPVTELPSGAREAVEVPCERDGNRLSCGTAQVPLSHHPEWNRTLVFRELEIRLTGGVAATGGVLSGTVQYAFPMAPPADSPFAVDLRLDDEPGTAALSADLLPTDPVVVALSEPARPQEVGLDGSDAPLVRSTGPGGVLLGLRADAVLLDWGTTVALDADLVDLSGNPIVADVGQVRAFPGLASDDLGFETGDGWASHGDVRLGDSLRDPAEGEYCAEFLHDGVLVGELDVPVDVTELAFAYALDAWYAPDLASLTVVDAEGTRTEVWSMDPAEVVTCGTLRCIPWTDAVVDLSPWAGSTVWLRFEVRKFPVDAFQPPPWTLTVAADTSTNVAFDALELR
ncbi:MAG: hypothetical protein R3F61_08680 [Myxococcota bacterium]